MTKKLSEEGQKLKDACYSGLKTGKITQENFEKKLAKILAKLK
jgi:hypothetical protein